MKLFVVALVIISVVAVIADDDDEWLDFKMKFGKLFLSKGKELKRKQAFKANMATHNELKAAAAAGEISFEPAIYAFHDLEPEEIIARMTGLEVPDHVAAVRTESPTVRQTLPKNYDSKKYLGAVRNQKSCGSCWAFSSVSAIEAVYTIKHRKSADLSEQHLVDCSRRDSANVALDGCQGGWMETAFDWIKNNGGITDESLYPYQAVFGTCNMGNAVKAKLAGYVQIANNTNSIKAAVMKYGSLAIAVDANKWSYYGSGIFSTPTIGNVNHAVNLVGWGYNTTLKQEYWLIRNTWGATWGEQGYIRVATTKNGTYERKYTFAVKLV